MFKIMVIAAPVLLAGCATTNSKDAELAVQAEKDMDQIEKTHPALIGETRKMLQKCRLGDTEPPRYDIVCIKLQAQKHNQSLRAKDMIADEGNSENGTKN